MERTACGFTLNISFYASLHIKTLPRISGTSQVFFPRTGTFLNKKTYKAILKKQVVFETPFHLSTLLTRPEQ